MAEDIATRLTKASPAIKEVRDALADGPPGTFFVVVLSRKVPATLEALVIDQQVVVGASSRRGSVKARNRAIVVELKPFPGKRIVISYIVTFGSASPMEKIASFFVEDGRVSKLAGGKDVKGGVWSPPTCFAVLQQGGSRKCE